MESVPLKEDLIDELIALLQKDLEVATHAQAATASGVTHADAKAEGDKDMRATEQSYLARGQAMRVEEIHVGLSQTLTISKKRLPESSPIAYGALITAEEDDAEVTLLMAPARGGTKLRGGVQVVTSSSPLGRALLGKHVGDDCEIKLPQKTRTLSILRIE